MAERTTIGTTTEDERFQKVGLVVGMVGCLASGKTTLSAELGKRWGLTPVEENYPENPYLADFYENPPEFSFKSQVFFMSSKVEQLQNIDRSKANLIDPSLTMDFLYAKTHHKMGWMTDNEWNSYQTLFYTVTQNNKLVYPDMHVVVMANKEDLEKRIVERNRPYEMWILKNYPKYLVKLSESVEEWSKEKHRDTYVFVANTSGDGLSSSVEQIADRVESHVVVHFGLGNKFVLPRIKPSDSKQGEDLFPGKSSESLRFAR